MQPIPPAVLCEREHEIIEYQVKLYTEVARAVINAIPEQDTPLWCGREITEVTAASYASIVHGRNA